jgi:predicted SnoaL-like aldol condensation-catalyzing enzyme
MPPVENKTVITSFVEEVINQGEIERADDLVAVDFVELDPLPGQQQGREGLKQVIGRVSHRLSRHPLGNRGDGRRRGKGI